MFCVTLSFFDKFWYFWFSGAEVSIAKFMWSRLGDMMVDLAIALVSGSTIP